MELNDMRKTVDGIDNELVRLIIRRLDVAKDIAAYKKAHSLPVLDPQREREKLAEVAQKAGDEYARACETLFSVIFDLSRSVQHRITSGESPVKDLIKKALSETEPQFPVRPLVACQGVEGAYSQLASERLFPSGSIMYFNTFESVFAAVEQGLCRYGVLPVENSTAGSVNRIYDLMTKYDFYIVRSCRLKIDHCLLANEGTALADIKEIFSHEQAIAQCQDFLKTLPNVRITPCENTAAAAKHVFESGRRDSAALSSRNCAALYGLSCLVNSAQDSGSNFTRFICISKKPEIYPGADRTSLMLVLPNRPGSLYSALARFNALGINLIKLESRPLANSDFEFMFYFDLDTSVYSDAFLRIFDDLQSAVTMLKYLGSYTEVV
jgi:chorismate mutase/prephenate dehydratase